MSGHWLVCRGGPAHLWQHFESNQFWQSERGGGGGAGQHQMICRVGDCPGHQLGLSLSLLRLETCLINVIMFFTAHSTVLNNILALPARCSGGIAWV